MPRSPSIWDVWTWPLAAGAHAGELAFRALGEFWASSEQGESKGPEPLCATPNQPVLELTTLRVRDFSHCHHGPPTVIVAPLALHGAAMADFAHQHSLVERLLVEGLDRSLRGRVAAERRSRPEPPCSPPAA